MAEKKNKNQAKSEENLNPGDSQGSSQGDASSGMKIRDLLNEIHEKGASDLHIASELPPIMRVDGNLKPMNYPALSEEKARALVLEMIGEEREEQLKKEKEIDFSFSYKKKARFRVNAFHEKNRLAAAIRLIPMKVPTIEELKLPEILNSFCKLKQGFVLVTGPTGQGKSTTIAAMVRKINETRNVHILTIEDPIEYVFEPKKALISQREMFQDTNSWDVALRSALREDPNVVVVGEMRDYETIASAITVAETGHLVFATLHTNSASQSIDRMVDVFPEHQQSQIRVQLAGILEGVISQRLLSKVDGGRIVATEVMKASSAIRNLIREGKSHQIDNVISTSGDLGMISLEQSLADLVKNDLITEETAMANTMKPQELTRLLRR